LIINKKTSELSVNKNPQWAASCDTDILVPHHIYITSDEEIKEGDWFIALDGSNDIYKANKVWLDIIKENTNPSRKIILTTDQDLIADGVQPIDDEFLEWFVENPSCEFVDVKLNSFGECHGNDCSCFDIYDQKVCIFYYPDYEVVIPQEESKQELPASNIDWSGFPQSTKDTVGYVEPKQEKACTQDVINAAMKEALKNTKLPKVSKQEYVKCTFCEGTGQIVSSTTISGFKTCDCINITQEEPQQESLDAAHEWVFETNGHKWSNNDDTAGDNYGSFKAGAKWQAERMYSKQEYIKCTCANSLEYSNCDKKCERILFEEQEELAQKPIEPPIGDFIFANANAIQLEDGYYYHYSEVCKLLKLQAERINSEENIRKTS